MSTETPLNDGEGLEIAHPEDFGIKRDEDGELTPVKQRIPETEMAVRCKPLVNGAVERWEDVLEGANPEDGRVDEFFREYIVEGIGAGGLEEVPDYMVPMLIEAVKRSSGYEVFQKLQQRKEQENLQAFEHLEKVPEDLLMKFMDMDDDEINEITDKIDE